MSQVAAWSNSLPYLPPETICIVLIAWRHGGGEPIATLPFTAGDLHTVERWFAEEAIISPLLPQEDLRFCMTSRLPRKAIHPTALKDVAILN